MEKYRQLYNLKSNLEDFDFYIKEIEETLTMLQYASDPVTERKCMLRLAQLRQDITAAQTGSFTKEKKEN